MGSRLQLQTVLENILGSDSVYFQPPSGHQMVYPCIVYERSLIDIEVANNNTYKIEKRYTITVIDKDPDSSIPDQISMLPRCNFDRHFTVDNLNHDIFTIYF